MASSSNCEISVILPTYNEGQNIIDLIAEISLYIRNHLGRPFEFIVVDDDSPDKTWQIAQEHFAADSWVKVIRRTKQKGLAASIRQGIQEASGQIVVWLDCDFSMPTYKVPELINKVLSGYDVAVGSRFIQGGKDVRGPTDSWLPVILSQAMNSFISFSLGSSFKDYTSGFVAARKDIFEKIKIRGDYGEYFIEFIYQVRKQGFKLLEIPYYCLPRRAGSSKTGANLADWIKKGWKYIILTLDLKLGGKG
ncbi:glycosyltransferase [Candidatus Omnitrophota bacterium]